MTPVSAGRASGIARASLSSAGPVAVVAASALPVQRPTGVVSTKRSISASGPRAMPSMSSRALLPSSGIRPCSALHSTLPRCALAARISSVERSTTSSPEPPVNGGQTSRRRGRGRGARRRRRRRLAWHIGEGQAVELAGNAEVAVARDLGIVEREVPQVAADTHRGARDRAGANGAGDVAAHAFRQAERQVARGARGDAVDQATVELELARIAAAAAEAAAVAAAPGRAQLALGVGVGEARCSSPGP